MDILIKAKSKNEFYQISLQGAIHTPNYVNLDFKLSDMESDKLYRLEDNLCVDSCVPFYAILNNNIVYFFNSEDIESQYNIFLQASIDITKGSDGFCTLNSSRKDNFYKPCRYIRNSTLYSILNTLDNLGTLNTNTCFYDDAIYGVCIPSKADFDTALKDILD